MRPWAKTVRAAVLGEAQLEYVQAARLRNEHFPYVLFAEILPNVMGPVIVEFLKWVVTNGQKFAADLDYAPLPADLPAWEPALADAAVVSLG